MVGLVLGFFLFKLKHKEITLKLNQWVVWVAWGACFATLLGCVLGGHSTLRGPEYDRWGNVSHITFVRNLWSLANAWIIIACCNGYGGEWSQIPKYLRIFKALFQVRSTGSSPFLYFKYLTDSPTVYT